MAKRKPLTPRGRANGNGRKPRPGEPEGQSTGGSSGGNGAGGDAPVARRPGRPVGSTKALRTPDQMARDRAAAMKRYLRGKSQTKIAEELTAEVGEDGERVREYLVTLSMVHDDIGYVRREWSRVAFEEWDALRGEQLARLDAIESEAWEAWFASKGLHKKRTTDFEERDVPVDPEKPKGERRKLMVPVGGSETAEDLSGDPRFLQVAYSCVDRRCKLLGLDALNNMTMEELDRVLDAMARDYQRAQDEASKVIEAGQ